MNPTIPSRQQLEETYLRLQSLVHRTPVLCSSLLDELSGAQVYFKCENFQRSGSFKMRGALNSILSLGEAEKKAGVVTHSSGNFGQAVALAASSLGVKAYIVMPENAPEVKKNAVRSYDGIITICESTIQARETAAGRIQNETGATLLHPSNSMAVILGNSTATIELLEELPDLDMVLAPIGGGGLIAGTALAAHYYGIDCQTLGGEPFEVDDAYRSLQSGKIETNETINTIADGLRTHLGDINFPIIQNLVSEIIRVEEQEIIDALRLIWERMKIVIEPSCAVPFAALLREKEKFEGKKVGIIISGGNVDLSALPF